MRSIKRASGAVIGACLAAALMYGGCLTAAAAGGSPDTGRRGSISLTLYSDEAGAAVTDGALTIYEVAALVTEEGETAYVKTEPFSGYGGSLDPEDAGLAAALEGYVAENGVEGIRTEISPDGSVEFSDLALGLYLIVQTTESSGYFPIDPFIVTVPIAQDGAWVYEVDAGPKVELSGRPQTPPDTETPPGIDTTDTPEPTPAPTPGSSPGARLPQTGQPVWPIVVLAAAGGLSFAAGAARRKKARADN